MNMKVQKLSDWSGVAQRFLATYPNGGIFGLVGDLGVGKTTFVRALIEQLARRENKTAPRVISPSFVLHQSYSWETAEVEHFDFYRLENLSSEGLMEIGFSQAADKDHSNKAIFVFVEWPEKAPGGSIRFTAGLFIRFDPAGERDFAVSAY